MNEVSGFSEMRGLKLYQGEYSRQLLQAQTIANVVLVVGTWLNRKMFRHLYAGHSVREIFKHQNHRTV